MNDFWLILGIVAVIASMLLLIVRCRVHPFIAITVTAVTFAVIAIPLERVPTVIGNGFGAIFSSIALVVIFGALIGIIMEKTAAALKLAELIVKAVGKKRPELAMMLMGWTISIPVFCDSGFVLLNPIRQALCRRTGAMPVVMTTALAAGLFSTHCLVPPTPGPVAAAGFAGVENNLLLVIAVGVLVSIPCLCVAWLYGRWIGSRLPNTESQMTAEERSVDELLEDFGVLPGAWSAVLPIALPIFLLAAGSVASFLKLGGGFGKLCIFLGSPVIALGAGVLVALTLLWRSGKLREFSPLLDETFKMTGPILFITGAGSMLGKVIVEAGFIELVQRHATLLAAGGILLPFLIAALLKTAQGSSTVAMVTTAALLGSFQDSSSLMYSLGLTTPWTAALAVSAIGVGAMTVSHANDSYFWVVTNFSGQSTQSAYRSFSVTTLLMGLAGMSAILVLKWIF